jgi:hypothetical protein
MDGQQCRSLGSYMKVIYTSKALLVGIMRSSLTVKAFSRIPNAPNVPPMGRANLSFQQRIQISNNGSNVPPVERLVVLLFIPRQSRGVE